MNKPLLIYASYLPTASVTATDSAAGYDPNDILQAEEDNVWRPANASGPKVLTFDLGNPQAMGCLALVGENLNGVTLEIRASADNFVTSDIQICAATTINDFIATWRSWGNITYRWWRLVFTGMSPSFALAHAAFCHFDLLPWFADGMSIDAYQTTGTQLVSPDGRFLGSNRQRTMRLIDLIWGKVTDAHFLLFQPWGEYCIHGLSAFFLVPDSSQGACYFSWINDPKMIFKAPRTNGSLTMPIITITSRVP
jgi:hypothetical protein